MKNVSEGPPPDVTTLVLIVGLLVALLAILFIIIHYPSSSGLRLVGPDSRITVDGAVTSSSVQLYPISYSTYPSIHSQLGILTFRPLHLRHVSLLSQVAHLGLHFSHFSFTIYSSNGQRHVDVP